MKTIRISKELSYSGIEAFLAQLNEGPTQIVIPGKIQMGGVAGLDARLMQLLITAFIGNSSNCLRLYMEKASLEDQTAVRMMEKALWIGAVWAAPEVLRWSKGESGCAQPIERNQLLTLGKSTMDDLDSLHPRIKGRQLEAVFLEGSKSKNYLASFYADSVRHKDALSLPGNIDGSLRTRSEYVDLVLKVAGAEVHGSLTPSVIEAVAHCLRELMENSDVHGMSTANSDSIERGVRYVAIKVKYLRSDKAADVFGDDVFLQSYGESMVSSDKTTTPILEVSVVDSGPGIPDCLRPVFEGGGEAVPDSVLIKKSLDRGVTSLLGPGKRHGFGLFHLSRHLQRNGGLATIRSGTGRFDLRYGSDVPIVNHQDNLAPVRGTSVTIMMPVREK
ncbi:MAG: hypothetical protein EA401_08090 [Planctomycetota bacterium]|nr:MAG: hypothetical protein EA401_08090 [Planctomycetota bacterium]